MKIDFEKVSIGYNKKNVILHDVSFSILDGEMVAIIGSSGSGKTTIFNAILKIASLLGGSILIDNKSIYAYSRRDWKKLLRQIGLLSQETFLFDFETPYTSILRTYTKYKSFFHSLFKIVSKKQELEIYDTLDKLKIFDKSHTTISQLSGGQKQRVEIAKLLLKKVSLILADEPTTSLDKKTSEEVIELLQEFSKENNATILVNIHDLDLVKKYFKKYIALKKGKLVSLGNVKDLDEKFIKELYEK